MQRLAQSIVAATLLSAAGCAASTTATSSATPVPKAPAAAAGLGTVRIASVEQVPPPAPGTMTRTNVVETPRMVTQVLRLAPGAPIAEHYHPYYDETFIVERGDVSVSTNDTPQTLHAGQLAVVPAGTVISGKNQGSEEAQVVVVFVNTGESGPLMIPGRPHQ